MAPPFCTNCGQPLGVNIRCRRCRSRLESWVAAAATRKEPLEHVLICATQGFDASELASVIATTARGQLHSTSGSLLSTASDLGGVLTKLDCGDVLFIGDIDRLPALVGEYLCPAMEDFKIEITLDAGMNARTVTIPFQPFTLIGATDQPAALNPTLRSLFRRHLGILPAQALLANDSPVHSGIWQVHPIPGNRALPAESVREENARTLSPAEKLALYVRSLSDFRIYQSIDGNYNHIGATVADAVLQANLRYETHVRPRVRRIIKEYPNARTTTAVLQTLQSIDAKDFLNWRGEDRAERFTQLVCLFKNEDIETETDLRPWLAHEGNVAKLRRIKGVGPKTVDYFKILVGESTAAVDRHLLEFLRLAEVELLSYQENQKVINEAADLLGIDRALFDHSIWQYMTRRASQSRAV